ncbi:MAG: hypothetical protein DI598_10660 [Pseudopedobacter saltans]|uniref:Uncharacterized protein n=1 Tax=Pseudopedobacter saltans TaxID=151895 RepID=A0A2W5EX81_9SPHI|nr:MAG: hypothetical protein DI598_10660 [Pseudopedobacter saltans]
MRNYIKLLGFLGLTVFILVSCSKEYSVDPDISKVDSSAFTIAEVVLIANSDSVVTATQVGVLGNNADTASNYIKLPIKVSKAGLYDIRTVAYFGSDSLILQGSGYVSILDSIIKVYPVNIGDFATGTYTTDSIKGNKVYWNDTATGYRINIIITVDQSITTNPTNPVSLATDSSWSFTLNYNGKDSVINGIFDDMELVASTTMPSQSVYGCNGDATGGTDYFNFDLSFKMPTDFSKLPITLSTSDINSYMNLTVTDKDNNTFLAATTLTNTKGSIIITKYDASTKTISGTFSGTLQNIVAGNSPTTCTISNGSFKARVP